MKLQIKRKGIVASEITITRVSRYLDEHEIKYIRTHKDYRGQGLASKLLDRARAKYSPLVAFLDDDGSGLNYDQMEAWYKRHGFKKTRYKFGPMWDKSTKPLNVMYWNGS